MIIKALFRSMDEFKERKKLHTLQSVMSKLGSSVVLRNKVVANVLFSPLGPLV